MDWVQSLISANEMPVVVAFLLGILTALSPCPLATNITAIGYITKDIGNKQKVLFNGLWYTLGRMIAYTLLGIVLIYILRQGASIFRIQKAISQYGPILLAPALIILGLIVLFSNKLKLPSFGYKGNNGKVRFKGWLGALILGLLFAMAFCPTSGAFYFGVLIPLSVVSTGGYFLPLVFAFATGLPVIIVAWILAYSVSSIGAFYGKMKVVQKWLTYIVGGLSIAVGIYYGIIYYF